jgi:putative hemolysin
MIKLHYALALALAAAACSSPAPETAAPASETASPQAAAPAVPADIAAIVSAAAPGISITGGELNNSKTEYEVTGTMPNGDEVEFDLVQANGTWSVLEIQRDVPWSSVPEPVRAAANAAQKGFEPVRVIESKEPKDGAVIYELFAAPAQGQDGPGGPAMEVRWHEGKAAVVP